MSFPGTRSAEQSTDISLNRAATFSRAVFFTALGLIYATVIVAATLTLNPYFSQTWDINTFIQAGHRFLDGGNPFDLYAASRTAQTWPYAYPPLHAFVTAIALFIGNIFSIFPDYVWARVPMILADIGVAIILHDIVQRKANDEMIARVAAILWLFNPVTFYDTAVQGHFESEWLLFVLLAYRWFDSSQNIFLPTIALAIAVLFKQTAIVFAIPIWMVVLNNEGTHRGMKDKPTTFTQGFHPVVRVATSCAIFAIVIGVVCLPYLLYSDDFLYMNLTYVQNVPVQTQSWLVAVLGLTRATPTAMTGDFFFLRYQTIITIVAATAIAFIGARRGWSLYPTAMLIAIAFFLTSKKVMGYYYVMLFPFMLAEFLPQHRFRLLAITTIAVTLISLSPYYAAWTNHDHWWIYAALGTINSLFFVWLVIQVMSHLPWRTVSGLRAERSNIQIGTEIASSRPFDSTTRTVAPLRTILAMPRTTLLITLGLFAGAVGAALLQPIISNNGSPIRAPIIEPGMESNTLITFGALIIFNVIVLAAVYRATKNMDQVSLRTPFVLIACFAPLFFSVYTLTKESTAIFEIALKVLGV